METTPNTQHIFFSVVLLLLQKIIIPNFNNVEVCAAIHFVACEKVYVLLHVINMKLYSLV